MTPITPLEPGVEMFERGKSRDSFFSSHLTVRSSLERPVSGISVAYTDIEDDSSEFEEYSGSSVWQCGKHNRCSLLTDIRATIGEAKQPSQLSRKCEPLETTSDHNMPTGICPKLSRVRGVHTSSVLRSLRTILITLCRCHLSFPKT